MLTALLQINKLVKIIFLFASSRSKVSCDWTQSLLLWFFQAYTFSQRNLSGCYS